MAALQAYSWPGNVRQLRNVVDWLLIMAPGEAREPVRADMLPNEITAIAPTVVKWDRGSEIMTLPLRDAREVFEREYLLGPGDPLRRQHLAHRGLCRHGALGPAPQIEIARPCSATTARSRSEHERRRMAGGARGGRPADFRAPTNPPQPPPSDIPAGWRVRVMPPSPYYPNGYWRLEKPMANGGWQAH